jgi:adenylate cyclase class 2
MGQLNRDREVEIKLRVAGAEEGRATLEAAGFTVSKARAFEDNVLFDNAAHTLRQAGTLLRVREVEGAGVLTYKGPATPGRHKDREELEVPLPAPATMNTILSRVGFTPVFRYQKFRTEYTDGTGTATLDETPIGFYLELEGDPEWIDRTAARLGFAEADYVTGSYLRLYLDDCAARGVPPGDMVFARV